MELQWPLILFTTLTAGGCGVLGGAGVLALKGAGKKSQQLLAILSCVLLALGGIAVFFHLQHWERIFNGFGHITSGITQELIAIVAFVAVAVAYFAMARKSDDGGTLPKGMAWVAIAISVVLAAVCAHSYMMPARPAWDSVLEVLSIVGAACLLGPATCAVVLAAKGEDAGACGLPAVAGSAIGAVCTAAYAAFIQLSAGAFSRWATTSTRRTPPRPWLTPPRPWATRPRCCGSAPWSWARPSRWPAACWPRRRATRPAGRSSARLPSWPPSPAPSACAWPSTTWACPCSCSARRFRQGLAGPPGLAAPGGPASSRWFRPAGPLAPQPAIPCPAAARRPVLPGGPHRVAGRQPNTLKRPLPLGDTLSPNPPCKQGRLQAKGAALRLGSGHLGDVALSA
ncbi:MAG: DmsC/YnfH family molybdoenzyme membrane anchor subunit [Senegalimassilia anaerobia]